MLSPYALQPTWPQYLTSSAQPSPASADSFRGSVLSAGTSIVDGSLALVLELMPSSLHQYLENSRLNAADARPLDGTEAGVLCKLALETALGLAYLHRSRYLHGDVKSPNVMLDSALHAKVVDFGISAAMGGGGEIRSPLPTDGSDASQSEHSMQTLQSRAVGTLRYLAPELVASAITSAYEYDERCDVYSFGLLLWEVMHQQVGRRTSGRVHTHSRARARIAHGVCDVRGAIVRVCERCKCRVRAHKCLPSV
jgi:serine/threonine protein kinase